MQLFVKHMVSLRCILLVKELVEKLGLSVTAIRLGVIDISESPSALQLNQLKTSLLHSGLSLLEGKNNILIERIKILVIEMVHHSTEEPKTNFSDYLSSQLHYNYTYMANLFSAHQGITIEHFIIHQKIERTKELLGDKELSLTEIAFMLHYSSVGHLSAQFCLSRVSQRDPAFFPPSLASRECEFERPPAPPARQMGYSTCTFLMTTPLSSVIFNV